MRCAGEMAVMEVRCYVLIRTFLPLPYSISSLCDIDNHMPCGCCARRQVLLLSGIT